MPGFNFLYCIPYVLSWATALFCIYPCLLISKERYFSLNPINFFPEVTSLFRPFFFDYSPLLFLSYATVSLDDTD